VLKIALGSLCALILENRKTTAEFGSGVGDPSKFLMLLVEVIINYMSSSGFANRDFKLRLPLTTLTISIPSPVIM